MTRFKRAMIPGRWISTCGRFTIRPAVESNGFVLVDLTTGGYEFGYRLDLLKQRAGRYVADGLSIDKPEQPCRL